MSAKVKVMEKGPVRQARQLPCRGWRGKGRLLAGLALVALSCGGAAAAYHPAKTPAEIALRQILEGVLSGKIALPGQAGAMPDAKAASVTMTARMLSQIVRETPAKVKACRPNEECEWRYYPVTCRYDGDLPVFQTTQASADHAVISFKWAETFGSFDEPPTVGTYRLVRVGEVWKLDEVRCNGGAVVKQ
jgi:hypothetical protein